MNVSAPKRGRLFQEYLKETPFWMLVACSLVNLTTFDQAEPALEWLMANYTHETLAKAREEDLHERLEPLGLWRRRAKSLIAMARAWTVREPRTHWEAAMLPGVGKYGQDSWKIFIEGRTDVLPDDGKLNWYMERMRNAAQHA